MMRLNAMTLGDFTFWLNFRRA